MSATHKPVRPSGKQCFAVNDALDVIRDKWTLLVMGVLSRHTSLRYNELQREIGEISQRMLTLTLKALEQNGLVSRAVTASIPPRVDYALTPLGQTLVVPLRGLMHWSRENHDAINEARRAYAARTAASAPSGS